MGRNAIGATALAAALTIAPPALAQVACGEHDAFMERLQSKHGESLHAVALVSDGNLLEVTASERGSWTILITQPDGTTCVVAVGEAWEQVPKIALGPAT